MEADPVAVREVRLERLDEIDPEELKRSAETVEQNHAVRRVFKPQSPAVE